MNQRLWKVRRRAVPTRVVLLGVWIGFAAVTGCSTENKQVIPDEKSVVRNNEPTTIPADSAWDVVLPDAPDRELPLAARDTLTYRDTVFSREDTTALRTAIQLADTIAVDSQFRSIIRQLGADEVITWEDTVLSRLPRNVRDTATQWLLGRYRRFGNYSLANIMARVPKRVQSRTRAWTRPCISPTLTRARACATSLNIWIVREQGWGGVNALAGTLVHERMHTLWQVHAHGQTRPPNVCDAAYVMGDVAQALLIRRETARPAVLDSDLCPGVQDRLEALRIVEPRPQR